MRDETQARQRPRIVAVDHDPTTRVLLAAELDARYGRHYDVVVAGSGLDAIASLGDNTAAVDVALVLAERHEDGAELLAVTRARRPHAKRALLIGWNEH